MKKVFLVLLSFYLAIVFLMPKVSLYYTLKTLLAQQHVVLQQTKVKDRWFDLKISGLKLYYDGIESAEVETVKILPWLFFNQIKAENLKAGKDVKKMFDFQADEVLIRHSVIAPFVAEISASGNFGKIDGTLELKKGKLKLICEPSKSFHSSSMFRELFRKRDEGYVHESVIQ